MGLLLNRNQGVEVFEHQELQQRIYALARERYDFRRSNDMVMSAGVFAGTPRNKDDGAGKFAEHAVRNESPEDALAIDDAAEERAIRIERISPRLMPYRRWDGPRKRSTI